MEDAHRKVRVEKVVTSNGRKAGVALRISSRREDPAHVEVHDVLTPDAPLAALAGDSSHLRVRGSDTLVWSGTVRASEPRVCTYAVDLIDVDVDEVREPATVHVVVPFGPQSVASEAAFRDDRDPARARGDGYREGFEAIRARTDVPDLAAMDASECEQTFGGPWERSVTFAELLDS
jgi:hypothetical protein